ncbi:DUF5753 domain-containing protein [Streptomyces sp. NBC_01136]|uniref:DUF5753 domain-containing protein n=1 Tax=unclassified Streptomyces TaxID=2593676 RepID=UPI00324E4BEB|nr:DUF5753 domain-containing protein [Streptomyces sp. NBC_01136]
MKLEPTPGGDGVQGELAAWERDAHHLRYFLPAIPTGLIQTPEYMRHVMTRTSASAAGDVTSVMALKLARQAVLEERDKRFEFVLTESALRWKLGDGPLVAGQLEHLVSLSLRSNVAIGVLPLKARIPEVPFNTFTVYDADVVTLEVFTGRVVLREPQDVAHYRRLFECFSECAVEGDGARRLLERWAEESAA